MSINPLSLFFIPALLIAIIFGFILGRQTNTVRPQPSLNPTATPKPTVSLLPLASSTPQQTSQTHTEFYYPNAKIVSENGNNITLESTDDANIITNWYKEKIRTLGMNAQAFSQTNTNGNILNKLTGARENKKIEVTITKSAGQEGTTIDLKL